jgi:hypothetical protein
VILCFPGRLAPGPEAVQGDTVTQLHEEVHRDKARAWSASARVGSVASLAKAVSVAGQESPSGADGVRRQEKKLHVTSLMVDRHR